MRALAISLALLLAGCSAAQLSQAQQDAQAAVQAVAASCAYAQQQASLAGAVVTGGAADTLAQINEYLAAACDTAQVIIGISQLPTTQAWLNEIAAEIAALQAQAKPKAS